jgi:type VI secretion system protein ImpA
MPTDPVIDIDSLCSPISEEQRAGPYWRDNPECQELYSQVDSAIREARRNRRKMAEAALFSEDAIERRNYEDPDWGAVIKAGTRLLEKSKDLWVATWMIEALAYVHGFPGLRDGIRLVHQFCEKFWDSVYPRPDELDGILYTMSQLDGDILAELVLQMPITGNGLTTTDYDKSSEMDGLESESEKDAYRSLGVVSIVEFEVQVQSSGVEFLQNLLEDVRETSNQYTALTELLDQHCGHDAPASSKVKENFQQTIDLIRDLAAPYLPIEEEADLGGDLNDSGDHAAQGQREPAAASLQSGWDRDQAFHEIKRLADLFVKHEPTSPVAWMLRRAVHLGKLAWPDLIDALAKDASDAQQILRQSGVAVDEETEES